MTIKIATRSSKLALAQVNEFVKKFEISEFEIVKIKTEGDEKSAKGEFLFDKAYFVSDIQKILLKGEADIAVHSAKDTPAEERDNLTRYFIPSKSQKDILIFREKTEFNKKMKLGTSSLRRQLQAKHHLNAENIFNLSGNVDTRLEKLSKGEYDCIILAKAGLERLDLLDEINYEEMGWSTASGQGYLGIEMSRDKSTDVKKFLSASLKKHHKTFGKTISIEREILKSINAGCNSAISMQTRINISSELIYSGEIYGKEEYISYSGASVDETIKDIKKHNGLKLLNEHN